MLPQSPLQKMGEASFRGTLRTSQKGKGEYIELKRAARVLHRAPQVAKTSLLHAVDFPRSSEKGKVLHLVLSGKRGPLRGRIYTPTLKQESRPCVQLDCGLLGEEFVPGEAFGHLVFKIE